MITIVNYGLGNLGSIRNMLKRIGSDSVISSDPSDLEKATKIILPGVGAFDTGMNHLRDNGWLELLNKRVLVDRLPVLGICLGMQLMAKSSEEGIAKGLGWVDAQVVKFTSSVLRVPHMGWNVARPEKGNSIFASEEPELRFYFVHSYYMRLNAQRDLLASTNYGIEFASAFQVDNIIGVQFHPEKSHQFGMRLLQNFVKLQ